MRRAAALLALALGAAPAACRDGVKPVRIAVHSAPQSFDPHLQNEILTSAVLANLYDGLTEFDEESRVVPALASEWRNPDERTWVFRLRPGVVVHDGRPVTAEDVLFSLERARHHSGSGLASYLVEVESVRVADPATIEIRTRRPFAALLAKLTAIAIVPADAPPEIEFDQEAGDLCDALEKQATAELETAKPNNEPGEIIIRIPCGIGWGGCYSDWFLPGQAPEGAVSFAESFAAAKARANK